MGGQPTEARIFWHAGVLTRTRRRGDRSRYCGVAVPAVWTGGGSRSLGARRRNATGAGGYPRRVDTARYRRQRRRIARSWPPAPVGRGVAAAATWLGSALPRRAASPSESGSAACWPSSPPASGRRSSIWHCGRCRIGAVRCCMRARAAQRSLPPTFQRIRGATRRGGRPGADRTSDQPGDSGRAHRAAAESLALPDCRRRRVLLLSRGAIPVDQRLHGQPRAPGR